MTGLQTDDLRAFTGFAPGASDAQITSIFGTRRAEPDPDPVQGRPGASAIRPCSSTTSANPNSCIWLGSEAALQANLDLSTEETTAITVTWEVTDLLT